MATGFNRLFLDTSPFIYVLDHDVRYAGSIRKFLDREMEQGTPLITSAISVAEYLVHPYKLQAKEKVKLFFAFLDDADIEVIPVGTEIADYAARIRAKYPAFKAMDALQLATAHIEGCDAFLTNGKQVRQDQTIPCVMVEDLETESL